MFELNKEVLIKKFSLNKSFDKSYLAKKLIKVARFISYREKDLNCCISNIKYNHLKHLICKTLKNQPINAINIIILYDNLKFYIKNVTNLKDILISEILFLFLSLIKKEKLDPHVILESIYKELSPLKDFFNKDIYYEKRRSNSDSIKIETLKNIISYDEYRNFEIAYSLFLKSLMFYNLVINGDYKYALNPFFFIENCKLLNYDFLEKYQYILKDLNLFNSIERLKILTVLYSTNLNLNSIISNYTISPSFYVQYEDSNSYIEKEMVNYYFYCSYHGGKRFEKFTRKDNPCYLLKKKEMMDIYKGETILTNIIFHKSKIIELETNLGVFLIEADIKDKCLFLMDGDYFVIDCYSFDYYFSCKHFIFQNNIKVVKNKSHDFFSFSSKNDYYEIVLFKSRKVEVLKIRFYLNKYEVIDLENNVKKTYNYNYIYESS